MKPLGDRTRLLAAALLVAAAAVHAVAAYEADHLETQLFYVFWGLVSVQVTVGLLVLARVPAGAVMALIVNVVVIAAYTVSRLVPLPGEEMAGPVGPPGPRPGLQGGLSPPSAFPPGIPMGGARTARPFYLTIWYGGTPEERRATPANTYVEARGMTMSLEDGTAYEDW